MSKDFANTVLMWEPTRNHGSNFDDIFDPDVKVLLSWRDVEAAVEVGAVVPSEAYALWAFWAAPGSPVRLAGQAVLQPQADAAVKPDPIAAMVPNLAPAKAVLPHPLAEDTYEPLEMKLPGQPKQRKGMPVGMGILLAMLVVAVAVLAIGKRLGLWLI
jgi:hypothetical protein